MSWNHAKREFFNDFLLFCHFQLILGKKKKEWRGVRKGIIHDLGLDLGSKPLKILSSLIYSPSHTSIHVLSRKGGRKAFGCLLLFFFKLKGRAFNLNQSKLSGTTRFCSIWTSLDLAELNLELTWFCPSFVPCLLNCFMYKQSILLWFLQI